MSRLRAIFTEPFPNCLRVLPGGRFLVAAFYLFLAGWLHYSFIYALTTGKLRDRISGGWSEARESMPESYWLYVSGFGAAVLFLDSILIYYAVQRCRNSR